MPPTMNELGIDRLSVEDRIAPAQEIWERIEEEAERSPLTAAQRQERERRLADSLARPDAVNPVGTGQGAGHGASEAVNLPVVLQDEARAE